MENTYSVDFFVSLLNHLQKICQQKIPFSSSVEVNGYMCVEIDNVKKERYVLSELIQNTGNIVSESFCTKSSQSNIRPNVLSENRENNHPRRQIQPRAREAPQSDPSVLQERSSSDSMMLPVCPAVTMCQEQDSKAVHNLKRRGSLQTSQYQSEFETFADESSKIIPDEIVKMEPDLKRPKRSTYAETVPYHSPPSTTNISYSPESDAAGETVAPIVRASDEIQITLPTVKSEPSSVPDRVLRSETTKAASFDNDEKQNPGLSKAASCDRKVDIKPGTSRTTSFNESEVIDLDAFEDEFESLQSESSQSDSFFEEQNSSNLASPSVCQPRTPNPNSMKDINPGSMNVMRSVVKRFRKYHLEKSGLDMDPLDVPPQQLNKMLLDFFMGAKKADGGELTVGSLKNTQVYLERYLKQAGYPFSITRDEIFKSSREHIKSRLEGSGKVKHVPNYIPVDDQDIEIFFQKEVLGSLTPETLFMTMWFMNSKYFGKKKPGEHFNLKWGDIRLRTNENGDEFLERRLTDMCSLKLFAKPDDPDRCFVNFYKIYEAMRPKVASSDQYPFYLRLNRSQNGSWYYPEAMPWSPFTSVWKKIVMMSGIDPFKRLM